MSPWIILLEESECLSRSLTLDLVVSRNSLWLLQGPILSHPKLTGHPRETALANSILKCFSSPLLFILQPDCIIQASFLNRNFRTVCCFGEGNSGQVGEEGQKTEREGWGEIVNVFDLLVPGIMHKCLISFNPTNILKGKCIIMLLSAENIAKVKRLPRVTSEKQSQILRNC